MSFISHKIKKQSKQNKTKTKQKNTTKPNETRPNIPQPIHRKRNKFFNSRKSSPDPTKYQK
jgi:hypothetical protein